MTSATYKVTGMTCEHCMHAVTGEQKNLDGVSDVRVGLVPGGLAMVTVTSEAPLSEQQVAGALDEAGDYETLTVPSAGTASTRPCACPLTG